jgi:hypothetical protein
VGEIDCREGILHAVEKDYYVSLEKAMEATIRQFVKGLITVASKKRIGRLMVHPIVPVLDETRAIVMAYNKVCDVM